MRISAKTSNRLRSELESVGAKVPEPEMPHPVLASQNSGSEQLESLRGEIKRLRVQAEDAAAAFAVRSNFLAARITSLESETAGLMAANMEAHERYIAALEKLRPLEEEVGRLKREFVWKPSVPRIGAWVGVTIDNAKEVNPAGPSGVVIRDLVSKGPADNAGLQIGDVVVSIDGRAVSTAQEFKSILAKMPGAQAVSVDVQRTNGVFRIPVLANDRPQ
jgi:S1-C subfamily serine protease